MIVKLSPDCSVDVRRTDRYRHKYGCALAEYLDLKGLDYADADTGSVEWEVHVMRFGRRLLFSDERGFVEVSHAATETEAIEAFETLDRLYAEWEASEEE